MPASNLATVYDPRRGSSAERGYGHRWRVYRLGFLAEQPLCVRCLAAGQTTAANIVDHIEPHKGCERLFWDALNHQALCRTCHDRKTVMEDGGLRPGRVNWHPAWLQPSEAVLTIVCGAPGSGKSTYVARHAGAGDVVIDVDVIGSALCGTRLHDWDKRRLIEVGRERNRQLMALAEPDMRGRRAWFIVSEPQAEQREWWHVMLQPEQIVVCETPASMCIARINGDAERPRTSGKIIEQWWRTYRRRPTDVVVHP